MRECSVCGVHNENDLRRLKSQIEELDGVGNAWIGPLKEGGVRGGSVAMEIEVENRVLLPALIQSVQALDEALLILPFRSNSWLWRYSHYIPSVFLRSPNSSRVFDIKFISRVILSAKV